MYGEYLEELGVHNSVEPVWAADISWFPGDPKEERSTLVVYKNNSDFYTVCESSLKFENWQKTLAIFDQDDRSLEYIKSCIQRGNLSSDMLYVFRFEGEYIDPVKESFERYPKL